MRRFRLFRISLCLLFFAGVTTLRAQTAIPAPESAPSSFTVGKPPSLSISGIIEICKGSETILKAEGEFESFIWEKSGVEGRYLKVREEGVYEVTAKTKGGCTYTTSVNVRVRPCT